MSKVPPHVPRERITVLRNGSPTPGRYVLYWMIAARRTRYNFALERAVEWCRELKLPLLIFEPLRVGYPWASDRLHKFVLEGMAENRRRASDSTFYYPYVEPQPGAGHGLLEALAEDAAVLVTDDYPAFFLPRMVAAAAKKIAARMEAVDGNGLYPMRATEQVFPTAYAFRRHLQRELPNHLREFPCESPLAQLPSVKGAAPRQDIVKQWAPASDALLTATRESLADLPIDHAVGPAAFTGGSAAAEHALDNFLHRKLDDYQEKRNDPDIDGVSNFSPYLHFGHLAAHEVFQIIAAREKWTPDNVASGGRGARAGWWKMSESAEAFLDQLVTWRELGFNCCAHRADYEQFESLPDWAKATLAKHERDSRSPVYTLAQLENSETYDELWNAAQRQLVRDGRLHNYLRMLWGKKILEWSRTPQAALQAMLELNNKYAVDGRDPNSYSGIFWVLGRYDRPWGPERPIFGTIRYMSSDNTRRKVDVKEYLRRYSADAS